MSGTFESRITNNFAASPGAVALRYSGASNPPGASLATFIYSTKTFDLTGSYSNSTGIFTAPVAGIYQVNAGIGLALTNVVAGTSTLVIEIVQAGSASVTALNQIPAASAGVQFIINISDSFNLAAGDTLTIKADTNVTSPAIGSAAAQYLSIFLV
jgi:hypothetical protein